MFNLSDFRFSDYHWIYPKKDGVKIVVGFDTYRGNVLFLRIQKLSGEGAELQEFPYKEKFLSEEFFNELQEILKVYSATFSAEKQVSCYFVMPDSMVSMDTATLPQMGKSKREVALTGHLNNLFQDVKGYTLRRYLVSASKKTLTYVLAAVKNDALEGITKALEENKMAPKFTTFSGSALLNAVIHFHPAYRKKSFILLDIRENVTHVVVCYRGRTFAYSTIQLGFKHLSRTEVLQENMLYNHDVANLAILNAQEKAKMKKLTVSTNAESDLEAVADDVIHQLEQGVNLNDREEARAQAAIPSEEPDSEEENDSEGEADDESEEEEERGGRRQKVFTRKTPKRLPKYMFRPEPTDEEGYVYENFRMFTKWAMLYYKWLREQEYLQEFEFVLVNLPKEFAFVVDRANAEEDKSELPFELFEGTGEFDVSGELDLFGGLYAGVYNKRFNF